MEDIDLELIAKCSSYSFQWKFYQNVNFENKNGGKYDFDKNENDILGRKAPDRTLKEFLEKKRQLELCSTKELKTEMKRRGKNGMVDAKKRNERRAK